MSKLALTTDVNGKTTYSIAPSQNMVSAFLTQNVNESFTVPEEFDFYQLNFSTDPGLRIWVSYDGNPAVIPIGSFTGFYTNSELNPTSKTVKGGTVINCITPDTSAMIGVVMYGLL